MAKKTDTDTDTNATKTDAQSHAGREIGVRIGTPGAGKILAYTMAEGTTVRQGLAIAKEKGSFQVDLRNQSLDVRVNGAKVSTLDIPLNDNDQVLLFTKIVGN